MAVDADKVVELTHAAMEGMGNVEEYNTSELLSACLTLTKIIATSLLELTPECRPTIIAGVQTVLLSLADSTQRN